MDKKVTPEDLHRCAQRLKAATERVTSVQRDFLAAHEGSGRIPHYKGLDDVQYTLNKLKAARMECLYKESDAANSIGEDANARARWLLRNRATLAPDIRPDQAVQDIQTHIGQAHDMSVLSHNFLSVASASGRVEQGHDSHETLAKQAQIVLRDAKRTADILKSLTESGPMNDKDVEKWHAEAPGKQLDDRPEALAENCYRLGAGYIRIAETALNRVANAAKMVRLIDHGLVPYELGDNTQWKKQRESLVNESVQTLNDVRKDYLRRPGAYIKSAINRLSAG